MDTEDVENIDIKLARRVGEDKNNGKNGRLKIVGLSGAAARTGDLRKIQEKGNIVKENRNDC